jgi:hypothetical protein
VKQGDNMSEEAMSKALDAIYEEAIKLLQPNLPEEVREGLDLIISIARYKFDNRSSHDKKND